MSLSVCFRKFPKLAHVCVCVCEREREREVVCVLVAGWGVVVDIFIPSLVIIRLFYKAQCHS